VGQSTPTKNNNAESLNSQHQLRILHDNVIVFLAFSINVHITLFFVVIAIRINVFIVFFFNGQSFSLAFEIDASSGTGGAACASPPVNGNGFDGTSVFDILAIRDAFTKSASRSTQGNGAWCKGAVYGR
jgi:hypothetical protein